MSGLLGNRVLRTSQVCELLGISRATLWRWEKARLIPPKRKIGPNTVGWLEQEVTEWLANRPPMDPSINPEGEQ